MNTLGKRIKAARESAGLMQADLASKIGVKSAGVISNWETDKSKPDADKIVSLCNVLGLSCSYLLDYYGSTEVSSSEASLFGKIRSLNELDLAKLDGFIDGLLSDDKYKKIDISHGEMAI